MDSDHKLARLIVCTLSACSASWVLIGIDLWMEILKRLPIQSLCQIRCVCKRWKSLITSPLFINLHHSFTSSTTPPNLKPYLRVNIVDQSHDSYVLYRPVRHDVHFPFQLSDDAPLHSLKFVDLIKGIVCVSYSLDSSFDCTILWNPAIQKYAALPRLSFPLDLETAKADFPKVDGFVHGARFMCNAIGFGYDGCKNDFKVVWIWIPSSYIASHCKSLPPTCEVYSAREGLWRSVIITNINLESWTFNSIQGKSRTGCFVNGTVHWLISTSNFEIHSVFMFDCEREEFRTMELPQEIYVKEDGVMSRYPMILEYGGMLAVVLHSCCGFRRLEWSIDMWVMEEHGVATTWKKLYRVLDSYMSDNFIVHTNQPSFEKLAPYGPNRWIKFRTIGERYYQVLYDHVYEESMFLLDDDKARSYTKEIVPIFVPIEFKKHSSGRFSTPVIRKRRSII